MRKVSTKIDKSEKKYLQQLHSCTAIYSQQTSLGLFVDTREVLSSNYLQFAFLVCLLLAKISMAMYKPTRTYMAEKRYKRNSLGFTTPNCFHRSDFFMSIKQYCRRSERYTTQKTKFLKGALRIRQHGADQYQPGLQNLIFCRDSAIEHTLNDHSIHLIFSKKRYDFIFYHL